MKTTWWWVRHGPTHADVLAGWTDIPADLSDVSQLSRLSSFLPERAVVISSDLSRASKTADAIAKGRKRLPDAPELREINFGSWDGKPFSQISQEHPSLSKKYFSDPGSHAPPGGESWAAVSSRVSEFVDLTTASRVGEHIVAVAHFGAILTQVQRATRQSTRALSARRVQNLSVTRLSFSADSWTMDLFSRVP